MNLLAIDTATEVCSAALLNGEALRVDYVETARDHSRLILKMLDALLANAGLAPQQLDGLAFGRGPGSFTGVRIAAGVTQGIALAVDCPVWPVSNLAAIAQRCYRESAVKNVLAAIDARMGEVYWGAYQCNENGLMQACIDESVSAPQHIALPITQDNCIWTGAGTGWCRHEALLLEATGQLNLSGFSHQLPHAQDILALARTDLEQGRGLAPESAQPVYLRDKVARTIAERNTPKQA